MKAIAAYIVDLIVTCIHFGIIFGVYYVMNGMLTPSFEKLTFGIAFLALFYTVENSRKIRELKEKAETKPLQKFSTSVEL